VITVLVVDDHPFMLRAPVELFAETPDIRVVGECADGRGVVEAVLRTEPDVVLMDLEMPWVDGFEATRALLAARPDARVLALTGTVTVVSVCRASALGVAGFLVKGEDPDDLLAAVRSVAAGSEAWSPTATARLRPCG
jgi:DNA-binding NarL/FixJ family response regulator